MRYQRGDTIEVDYLCDSSYMLATINRVGQSTRLAYHWIPTSEKCHLMMDNAGGHGIDEALEKYVSELEEKYNVVTIFQVPISPYTHVLDLGVWCALQARVETRHFGKQCKENALVYSVQETWDNEDIDDTTTAGFNQIRNVLVLIHEAKGNYNLVETKGGNKFRNLDLPEFLEDAEVTALKDEITEEIGVEEDI